jgi:alpha-mannosidase
VLVTLFRAIGQLSRDDLPTRPGHAAWPTATPLAQSLGGDRLQLALLPVDGSEGRADVVTAWEDVFLPPRPVWLRQATPLTPPAGELALEGAGLVVSAIKPAMEGGAIILRCYNTVAENVEGRWRLPFAAASAARVRADEREPQALALENGGRAVSFTAGPFGIVTVLLNLTGAAPAGRPASV